MKERPILFSVTTGQPSQRGKRLKAAVRERPILFSSPMVRAILAGTKSQTRRAVKPHRGDEAFVMYPQEVERDGAVTFWPYRSDDGETANINECEIPLRCSYGRPGDRLWVRETWAAPHKYDGHKPAHIPAGTRWHYAASENLGGLLRRRSIHMPRWASRITLEITGVRVERLQDISEADAVAEGVARDTEPCDHARRTCDEIGCLGPTCRASYCELWDSINGPGSWDANPWVWVVEFRRVDA